MKYLVVGLGNIGAEYADTRHNIGFRVLDALAEASNISFMAGRYGSTTTLRHKGRQILLLKPSTYMNLSGNGQRTCPQLSQRRRSRSTRFIDDGVCARTHKGGSR